MPSALRGISKREREKEKAGQGNRDTGKQISDKKEREKEIRVSFSEWKNEEECVYKILKLITL